MNGLNCPASRLGLVPYQPRIDFIVVTLIGISLGYLQVSVEIIRTPGGQFQTHCDNLRPSSTVSTSSGGRYAVGTQPEIHSTSVFAFFGVSEQDIFL